MTTGFGGFGAFKTTAAPSLTLGTPGTTTAAGTAPATGGFSLGGSTGFKLNTSSTGNIRVPQSHPW